MSYDTTVSFVFQLTKVGNFACEKIQLTSGISQDIARKNTVELIYPKFILQAKLK